MLLSDANNGLPLDKVTLVPTPTATISVQPTSIIDATNSALAIPVWNITIPVLSAILFIILVIIVIIMLIRK